MFMRQKDLIGELSDHFVKEYMQSAEIKKYESGDVVFKCGDAADYFFSMIKGRIRLTIGEEGRSVFVVSHPGEVFGWSSIVGRDTYSASAECVEKTKILKIRKEDLKRLFDGSPDDELVFYKNLTEMLGNRLLQSYDNIASATADSTSVSYGTGQVQDIAETV